MTQAADEKSVDQVFDEAFAAAAADAEKGVQTPEAKTTTEEPAKAIENKATDDPAAKAAADAKVAADAKAAEDAKAAADAKAAEAAAALAAMTPEQKAEKEAADAAAAKTKKDGEDAAARLQAKADADAAAKKKADEDAAARKASEETPEQKAQREALEASIKPYEPTEEEKKALEVFKKEFPESAAAVDARLKSMDKEVNARVYQAVQAVLAHVQGRLVPVEKNTEDLARQAHFETVRAAHSDYDQVVEKIPAWIEKQPALLQPTLKAAYEAGDTQSVLDLVATYKASVGTPSTKTPAQLAAEQKAADAAAAKAKQAQEEAAALAPVTSKRTNTSPKGAPDPNDYDGAFEEAAAAAAAVGKR